MINDIDIEFNPEQGKGKALVWVIDGECLYDIPLNNNYADMFLSVTRAVDVSSTYPGNDGVTVRLFAEDSLLEDFNTSEYFGSILLSEPQVINLNDYAYGLYVQSPYATFDGNQFTLTNRDMSSLLPWHPTHPRASENDQV
jgi:hypothetical protein